MAKYQYFQEKEFQAATPPCSLDDMDEKFMADLDRARRFAQVPFVINSAYRSKGYELFKGRTGNSWHTEGKAADIRCTDSVQRGRIIAACMAVGLHGFGIYKSFVHVDARRDYCVFLGDD